MRAASSTLRLEILVARGMGIRWVPLEFLSGHRSMVAFKAWMESYAIGSRSKNSKVKVMQWAPLPNQQVNSYAGPLSNCVVLLHNREFLNVYDAVLAALVCCAHGSLKLRNHRLCPLGPRLLRERRKGFHNTVLCYDIAIFFFLEAAQPANHWAKGYVRYVRRSKPSGAIR